MDGIDKTGSSSAAQLRPTTVTTTAPAAAATPAKAAETAVQTSSTSQAFAMLAEAAPVDTKKVEAIKSLIAAGAYPIDPQAVAAKMVALDFPAGGDSADA
jgi:flagellar biosynthesis anti-sigma factor FlgM